MLSIGRKMFLEILGNSLQSFYSHLLHLIFFPPFYSTLVPYSSYFSIHFTFDHKLEHVIGSHVVYYKGCR